MAQAKLLNTHNSVRNKSKPTPNSSSQPSKAKAGPSPTPAASTGTSASTKAPLSATKAAQPQRTVYKPVLDNPFQIEWPPLPSSLRTRLLDLLIEALQPTTKADSAENGQKQDLSISEWRELLHKRKRQLASKTTRQRGSEQQDQRKGKRKEQDPNHGQPPSRRGSPSKAKKARTESSSKESEPAAASTSSAKTTNDSAPPPPTAADSTHTLTLRSAKTVTVPNFIDKPLGMPTTPSSKEVTLPSKPSMLDSLVVGINDLTRALESQIRWARWELGDREAAPSMRVEKTKEPEAVPSDKFDKAKDKEDKTSKTRRKHRSPEDHARWDEILLGPHMTQEQKQVVDEPYRFLLDPLKNESLDLEEAAYIKRSDALSKNGSGSTFPKILNNSLAFRIKSPRSPALASGEAKSKTKTKPRRTPKTLSQKTGPSDPYYPLIDLVFVCKPDINPASLVGHLPTMCAATNGLRKAVSVERQRRKDAKGKVKERLEDGEDGDEDGMDVDEKQAAQAGAEVDEPDRFIYLIPLDVGAEHCLAEVMGLRRVAAIGVCSSSASTFAPLLSLVQEHLQPLFVPWLNPSPKPIQASTPTPTLAPKSEPRFIPTHIKHLKTTQPLNPRAAHALKEGKKKAREERRETLSKKKGKERKEDEVYVVDEDMDH
ncbi:hypothetical protein MVLG_01535 [Microbotryum lychnidis-dioicae p1A1 Lamole]|uniref:Uncharacterized protein n=1 Tax=Microbotryum lychnidis-dioicae (strain p1A1 Lamole / MvSl-1064) TaxID=683840 RepID=U5H2E7_USTV1|nr:hypothetical protein MVLG_01535 [Microbotryum lychnidis-dioicae p1A1 Lamole]|eukprot:KDE08270.1 hypothetical protein MVLG_01535 [Microbotryum lychnidis-dioicae p1A1 Lamole]